MKHGDKFAAEDFKLFFTVAQIKHFSRPARDAEGVVAFMKIAHQCAVQR